MIDFPNSPVNGQSYDYQGKRYSYVDSGDGKGYWAIDSPGSLGIASAIEINEGTNASKYITPRELSDSDYYVHEDHSHDIGYVDAAMTEAEFFSQMEQNKNVYAGSGVIYQGSMGTVVAA